MTAPYVPPVLDMLGVEVTEGDRIAVALSNGGSAGSKLKIGRVIKISKTRLTVLWETKKTYSFEKNVTPIDHGLKKFIVINELTN